MYRKIFKNPSAVAKRARQKGVSLLITFFILTIILAVVLSISALFYSQVKIIRNISNSVVAFYAADSGVEKVLYYDRKEIPTSAERGMCNICSSSVCPDCTGILCTPRDAELEGCDPVTCTDCQITFSSDIGSGKSYNIDVVVNQQCKISGAVINSYGFYENVSRAINLDYTRKVSTLRVLPSSSATVETQQKGAHMTITACIEDPDPSDDVTIESVIAIIRGASDENQNQCRDNGVFSEEVCTYRELNMSSGGGGVCGSAESYQVQWLFAKIGEDYTVSIMANDNAGFCVEASNIDIIYSNP
ncbi:MAG: pilus assembly PilX N-terminal domain-containing protein [Candidatus Staskawiczbacteria bacterium]|nr:pilus assembly PilX N-terminal domain-containing protein [Candidatus Staskawiczbacteria bacterium]